MPFEFSCDGCNTRGHGTRYQCPACYFDLHELCATCPNYISSNVHPGHQLVLLIRPPNSHRCDVCRFYTNGLSYTCGTCDFDAHPLCTQIPVAIPVVSFGGYHGVNNNHPVVINQQRHQKGSSNHSKVGKFATKLLLSSLTGDLSGLFSSN
ncbi:C1-like protein [Artemisia annua]|uniref:C1-like protein n=1 Tax=Artemisia annua TaxID=35608 RepID=A0A2U1PL89_ARTAN|nr:C1-like protein [Artemisia annua]